MSNRRIEHALSQDIDLSAPISPNKLGGVKDLRRMLAKKNGARPNPKQTAPVL